MKYLLIDTSIYEKEGFNFNQGYLNIISKLCKNGDLQLLTHKIIDGEIRSHMLEKVDSFKSNIKKLQNQSNIFYKNASYEILKKFDEKWFKVNSLMAYDKFLEDTKPIELKNDKINIDLLVKSYIQKEPPFGDGKKKNEFPDAIILNALLNYKLKKEDVLYIISLDNDWIKFAEINKIISYSNIYDFMNKVMSKDEQNLMYTEALNRWLNKTNNQEQIESMLIEKLDTQIEKLHDSFDDIDHNSTITALEDAECIWFDIDKKEFKFQVFCPCSINYILSFYDYDNAYYDREDGRYYNLEYVSRKYEDSTVGISIINLKFDINDTHIYIKGKPEIDDFQLNDTDFSFNTLLNPNWIENQD